ncbi:MAG: hypothetical protein L0Y32_03075 [Nevskiales bacterium]|nr:hypothetical protein [Nevskiales bacterium]
MVAGAFVWVCWQDVPSIQARAEFEALPAMDYQKEAEWLFEQERFSEALLVVEAGLEAVPEQQIQLQALHARIETERDSWLRKFQQAGQGALTGTGQSIEALGGAVVADLFVFGDVRDLVIQAGKKLKGEEPDAVIVALSAGGILLTVSPSLDLGSALLKFARRVGAMTDRFARNLLDVIERAVTKQNADEVLEIADNMAALSTQARPAGALAILKNIDEPAELSLAARFAEGPGAAFALWLGQKQALSVLKSDLRDGEAWLLKASRRGRTGIAHLAEHARVMLKPHPLLGLVKGFYKGNIPDLLYRWGMRWAEPMLGMALAWFSFELLLLFNRVLRLQAREASSEVRA